MGYRELTHQYLKCKPGITHTFYVEKSYVGICLWLIQIPGGTTIGGTYRFIYYVRDSHIRVGFQTE